MDGQASYSRRERQIMDIVYARGQASVTEVLADMADPPTRTAVRTMVRILEEKGHLKHHKKGREFIYQPTVLRQRAARFALHRLLEVFFNGSFEKVAATHLLDPDTELSGDELERIAELVRVARERKRASQQGASEAHHVS